MSAYSEFFLNSRASVVQLELLEVSHPDFLQTHRIVRNAAAGVTVDLSDDERGVHFIYYPAQVSSTGARDDLDSAIRVQLGDLGEVLPAEFDAVDAAGGFLIKPRVRYWVFRSDALSNPIFGPLNLEVTTFSFNSQGSSFEAQAPRLNLNRTGERYKLDRFPMLRGFL
jgi:hypothetical protein